MDNKKEDFIDWFREGDIRSSMHECAAIFDSGIFNGGGRQPLLKAAVTSLLINLSDLLQKARLDGRRVSSIDSVDVSEKVKDLTDLIKVCRNAACHISSGQHMLEGQNKFTFNCVFGYYPNAIHLNGVSYGSDYADDIAIFYGQYRVYVRRHLLYALDTLASIYPDSIR